MSLDVRDRISSGESEKSENKTVKVLKRRSPQITEKIEFNFDPDIHCEGGDYHNWFRAFFCLVFAPDVYLIRFVNSDWYRSSEDVPFTNEVFRKSLNVVQIAVFMMYIPFLLLTLVFGSLLNNTPLPTSENIWWPFHTWEFRYKLLYFHLLTIPILPSVIFNLTLQFYCVGIIAIFLFILEKGIQSFLIASSITVGIFKLCTYLPRNHHLFKKFQFQYVVPTVLFTYIYHLEAFEFLTVIIVCLVGEYFKDGLKGQKIQKDGNPFSANYKYWPLFIYGCCVIVHFISYTEYLLYLPIFIFYVLFLYLVILTGDN